MDAKHGSNDPDPGLRDARQLGDLAAGVHAHLEDRRLVLWTEPQHRERQPDLVVLVALVAKRLEAARQHGRRGFLRGRLGDAARHPDDQRAEARPPGGRERAQASRDIGEKDDAHVAQAVQLSRGRGLGDKKTRRAGLHGVGQEPVAVRALAGQGGEQLAGTDQS